MPTKRRRMMRKPEAVSPEELQWLSGKPIDGASKLWWFLMWQPDRLARCKWLVQNRPDLIPRGRRAELLRDIARRAPRPEKPKHGLASFR